ncbi:MAG: hypothetical protein BWY15_02330 [Firmicutes bacterium ADurb.Bin193]|nr:MAG: hypothetical protein BWY15_02330 [Firmicutes bacterium ADurb.Bin193]
MFERKIRQSLSMLLVIVMTAMLLPVGQLTVLADGGSLPSGSGTLEDPYIISCYDNLLYVQLHYDDAAYEGFEGKYFKQTANIDLSSEGFWTPIGDMSFPFGGIYDGNGYSINGLTIDTESDRQGLFGTVGYYGIIKNLGVTNVNINSAGDCIGGLAGYSWGEIHSCYTTGSVKGQGYIGGLAGVTLMEVINSYSTCSVTSYGQDKMVGGLVGQAEGYIFNSYAAGAVNGSNCASVGGLVGGLSIGTIASCFAANTVSGSGNDVAGIVATNLGELYYSHTTSSTIQNDYGDGSYGNTANKSLEFFQLSSNFTDNTNYDPTHPWDFTNTWVITDGVNNNLPYLINSQVGEETPEPTPAFTVLSNGHFTESFSDTIEFTANETGVHTFSIVGPSFAMSFPTYTLLTYDEQTTLSTGSLILAVPTIFEVNLNAGQGYKLKIAGSGFPGMATGYGLTTVSPEVTLGPPAEESDTTPPSISDKTIIHTREEHMGVRISFAKATDDTTSIGDMKYTFYYSKSPAMDTIAEIEENGKVTTLIDNFMLIFDATIAGDIMVDYEENTQYYYNIIVEDEAGNKACYNKGTYTTWAKPVLGSLTLTKLSDTSMQVDFPFAIDPHYPGENLRYVAFASKENVFNNIIDLMTATEGGLTIMKKVVYGENSVILDELEANTKYYFCVVVGNEDESYMSLYPTVTNTSFVAETELISSMHHIGPTDEPIVVDYNIGFNAPFDNTYKLTKFVTTFNMNKTELKIDEINPFIMSMPAAWGGLLENTDDITVSEPVTNGTITSVTVTYENPVGVTAKDGILFGIRPYIKADAIAGDTVIYTTDTSMTLTKDGETYLLGTGLYPINEIPGTLTLDRQQTSTLSLALCDVDYFYGGETVSDKSRITSKGNVINADADTEITVPVISLSGVQDNVGAIKATFTFDASTMTFMGMEGTGFVADATGDEFGHQTGEIKVYGIFDEGVGVDYNTPFDFKFKFRLDQRQQSGTSTDVYAREFKVFPIIGGTISDVVFTDLASNQKQRINFLDYGEILTNKISDSAGGGEISSVIKDTDTTLYSVITATEPLDDVTYQYEWYTNKNNNNFLTPIVGATGESFAVTDEYIGYRLKVKVKMMQGQTELHSMTSGSVLVKPKDSPEVTMGNLIHTDGFKTGKTIGYNPTVTYIYENIGSDTATTYQWSWSDSADGVYLNIADETDKNLVIDGAYINKWLRLTVTASEEIGECTQTTPKTETFFLGGEQLVPKPTITAVTVVHNDGSAISVAAKARDNATVKASVVGSDAAQILTGYQYQWYREGVAIEGATGENYTLTKEDVGSSITVNIIALSDYYTEEVSSTMTSAGVTAYANLNNAPSITAGEITVTDNKYVVGNTITLPFAVSKFYDLDENDSSLTKLAYSVKLGDDQTAAATGIDGATELELTDTSISYRIKSGDMNKRYIVFKLMARENTLEEDIAIGSTVVVIDTYTGQAINWSYTLDFEVTDNEVFDGYKAYAIVTNIGKSNTLSIAVNDAVVHDANAKIFYSPERGRYVVLMPSKVTPDINKFVFNEGSTPVIYYGKQDNTNTELSSDDYMKPIDVWLKKVTNATSENMLVSEVSGNGEQNPIDAAQMIQAILQGTEGVDKKAGSFGILSK